MKTQWNRISKLGVPWIDDVNIHSEGNLYVTKSKYINKTEINLVRHGWTRVNFYNTAKLQLVV